MTEAIENEIRNLEQAWTAAEQSADADTLDELTVPEFHLVGPLGFVLTRQQWSERYRSGDLRTAYLDWQIESLTVYGDAAVTLGTHTQQASYQGHPADGAFRSTHVATRRDGRWKLAAIQLSPIQRPPVNQPAGGRS